MASLAKAIEALTAEADDYVIEAPEAWSQGRTLYGGMTAALCHETALMRYAPDAPLRSAQFTFPGPATGLLRLRPVMVRQGRSATIIAVDCLGEGGAAARSTFVFGSARQSNIEQKPPACPSVPLPEECPPFFPEDDNRPGFMKNFEMRLAAGSHPFSGSASADFSVWVRFCERPGVDATTALLALGDALPPAAIASFPSSAPLSTMTWTMDLARPSQSVDDWHLLRSWAEQSADGYSLQTMDLWDSTGASIATGRQTVAIFI